MRKSLSIVLLIVCVIFNTVSAAGWYSRARQIKWVADSLKRIDTLRIADSIHKADSLVVLRYQESDSILAIKKQQEAEDAKKTIPIIPDSVFVPIPGQIDITSGRTITVDPRNPYAKTIDSLQKVIDSLNEHVYGNDARFKEMKSFPISDKKRYMLFLLKNNLKDTAAIAACAHGLLEVYKTKYELLIAIKNSQDPNTKTFIQAHIEEHMKKMAELSNFILAMTPKVPFMPQRSPGKKLSDQ